LFAHLLCTRWDGGTRVQVAIMRLSQPAAHLQNTWLCFGSVSGSCHRLELWLLRVNPTSSELQ
jgi:hypothetical protein